MNLQALGTSNADFGVDLYQKLSSANPDGNVFFSPVSVLFALAITLLGAKDETETEMKSVMKLDKFSNDELHPVFTELLNHLQDTKGLYELNIANKLYGEQSYKFLDEFMDECKKYYGTGFEAVDFVNDASQCATKINQWVESKTKDKIKDIIPQGVLDEWTRLVIVNAVYFNGTWKTIFDERKTKSDNFYTTPEKFSNVSFMHLSNSELNYQFHDKLNSQILELPYAGEAISFVVILPDLEKTSLKEVEEQLSGEILTDVANKFNKQEVRVSLPKFKLETESKVDESLKSLGINKLFSKDEADLSKMNGKTDLYVSKLLHKAFIEVDEKGSEAAAATAVVVSMRKSSNIVRPVTVFKADHPFIFFLKDKHSGAILFMGKLLKF